MRIIISVTGTRGDVAPMLALARELARRGHEPVVSAPPGFGDDAANAGVAYRATGLPSEASLRAWGDPGERIGWRETYRRQRAFMDADAAAQFEALAELSEGADLVVGAGLPLAARSVAEARGIPYRYVHYCPQALPSAEHPPVGMPWAASGLAHRAMWAGSVGIGRFLAASVNPHRARLGLPPLGDAFAHALGRDARPVVAADRALAPVPGDVRVQYTQTASIATLDRGLLSSATDTFLAAGAPPVLVAFGSMVPELTGRLAEETRDALAATGARGLLSAALLPGDPGGAAAADIAALAGYEPHGALLPRVAAVVHHGGAGTFFAAARAGVPQVIVTHGWDQEYFGRRAAALGVGPAPLHVARLPRGALVDALRVALRPATVLRAREVAALLGEDGGARTADELLR